MEQNIIVNNEGYHLIGKIGCELSECANIGLSEVVSRNPKVKYHSEFLHETPYENQISLIKKSHNNFELKLKDSDHSPAVFYNGEYVGGWFEMIGHLEEKWGVENSNCLREKASHKCQRRKFEAFNMTEESFVTFEIVVDHPDVPKNKGRQNLVIQLFDKYCPKTSKRFKELCNGVTVRGVSATYKGNNCSRVAKDSFIQFGNLLMLEQEAMLEPLEDESYQLKNDYPGMIGMVSGNERHSNSTQFYITVNSMKHYNGKQVVFGRVISGFHVVDLINSLQNPDDLKPTMNATIVNVEVHEKQLPPEIIEKQRIIAGKLPPTEEVIEIAGPKKMKEFFSIFD